MNRGRPKLNWTALQMSFVEQNNTKLVTLFAPDVI